MTWQRSSEIVFWTPRGGRFMCSEGCRFTDFKADQTSFLVRMLLAGDDIYCKGSSKDMFSREFWTWIKVISKFNRDVCRISPFTSVPTISTHVLWYSKQQWSVLGRNVDRFWFDRQKRKCFILIARDDLLVCDCHVLSISPRSVRYQSVSHIFLQLCRLLHH